MSLTSKLSEPSVMLYPRDIRRLGGIVLINDIQARVQAAPGAGSEGCVKCQVSCVMCKVLCRAERDIPVGNIGRGSVI